ncbi:MAG: 50S ribosomal protein L11 methyltransferase [Mahellales bacterium]|jgi:ribosomal protein L11 methyltransferase
MDWVEIVVKTTSQAVEAVADLFYRVGAGGVVIEDPHDIYTYQKEGDDWNYIDPSLFEYLEDAVLVKGYFQDDHDLHGRVRFIKEGIEDIPSYGLDKGAGSVTMTKIKEEDWANSWKQYYKPMRVGNNIVIKPSWEQYHPNGDEIIIELDPGAAFGTGTHETTTMSMELIEKYVSPGQTAVDVGCGTGILAITAAKLGCKKVLGIDIDSLAVKVAKENVSINGVEDRVTIKQGNLLENIGQPQDIIIANIVADIIIDMMPSVKPLINPGGILIVSGIIKDRQQEVVKIIQETGFSILDIYIKGEWVALAATLYQDKDE